MEYPPVPIETRRQGLTSMFTIKEHAEFKRISEASGVSMANALRDLVLQALASDNPTEALLNANAQRERSRSIVYGRAVK